MLSKKSSRFTGSREKYPANWQCGHRNGQPNEAKDGLSHGEEELCVAIN